MSFTSRSYLNEQYKNPSQLDIRIRLHETYSTNPKDWHDWVFETMELGPQKRVIEFGCGSGALWEKHEIQLPAACQELVLTDVSEGMLTAANRNVGDWPHVIYKQMDIQSIEYEDNTFDVVIANHMLYHVPNIDQALSEVQRILKPSGVFYVATNGHKHMKEIYDFVTEFDSTLPFSKPRNSHQFGLENGEAILRKYFGTVDSLKYPSNLKVSNAQDVADYIYSIGTSLKEAIYSNDRHDEFIAFLETKKDEEGIIHITKDSGMFVCA